MTGGNTDKRDKESFLKKEQPVGGVPEIPVLALPDDRDGNVPVEAGNNEWVRAGQPEIVLPEGAGGGRAYVYEMAPYIKLLGMSGKVKDDEGRVARSKKMTRLGEFFVQMGRFVGLGGKKSEKKESRRSLPMTMARIEEMERVGGRDASGFRFRGDVRGEGKAEEIRPQEERSAVPLYGRWSDSENTPDDLEEEGMKKVVPVKESVVAPVAVSGKPGLYMESLPERKLVHVGFSGDPGGLPGEVSGIGEVTGEELAEEPVVPQGNERSVDGLRVQGEPHRSVTGKEGAKDDRDGRNRSLGLPLEERALRNTRSLGKTAGMGRVVPEFRFWDSYCGDLLECFGAGMAYLNGLIYRTSDMADRIIFRPWNPDSWFRFFPGLRDWLEEKGVPLSKMGFTGRKSWLEQQAENSYAYGDVLKKRAVRNGGKSFEQLCGDGDYMGAFGLVGLELAEALPMAVVSSLTGGAAALGGGVKVGQIGGNVLGRVMSGYTAKQKGVLVESLVNAGYDGVMKKRQLDSMPEAKDLPEYEKRLNVLSTACFSFLGGILSNNLVSGEFSRYYHEVGKDAAEASLEKGVSETMMGVYKKCGMLSESVAGGIAGAAERVAENITDYCTGVTKEWNPMEGVPGAFVSDMVQDGVFSGSGALLQGGKRKADKGREVANNETGSVADRAVTYELDNGLVATKLADGSYSINRVFDGSILEAGKEFVKDMNNEYKQVVFELVELPKRDPENVFERVRYGVVARKAQVELMKPSFHEVPELRAGDDRNESVPKVKPEEIVPPVDVLPLENDKVVGDGNVGVEGGLAERGEGVNGSAGAEGSGDGSMKEASGAAARNERFNEDLERFGRGRMDGKSLFRFGMPGEVLRQAGLPPKNITMSPKVLSACLKRQRVSVEDLRGLAGAIQQPVMVYEGRGRSVMVVAEVPRENGQLPVAVRLADNGRRLEVKEVIRLDGKGALRVLSDMRENRPAKRKDWLKHVDGEWMQDWLGRMKEVPEISGRLPVPEDLPVDQENGAEQ